MNVPFKTKDKSGRYTLERPVSSEEILAMARKLVNRRCARGRQLSKPQDAQDFLMLKLAHLEHEVFSVIFLDNRHRIIAYEQLFRGTIDGASVHAREVVKRAIQLNAAAIIFAHNHPSGVAEPSAADESITRRLSDALKLVDVRVLDHLIVAGADVVSFAERGLL